jgi:hypothetical protein
MTSSKKLFFPVSFNNEQHFQIKQELKFQVGKGTFDTLWEVLVATNNTFVDSNIFCCKGGQFSR